MEPCLAQSLVLQLAQRKSAQEERSPHLLPQRDGRQRLQGQRNEALLLRSTARRKEKWLRSLRVRVEALRLNRGELHHEGGGGSQRAHSEVRRPYERHLSRACDTASARGMLPQTVNTTPPGSALVAGASWRASQGKCQGRVSVRSRRPGGKKIDDAPLPFLTFLSLTCNDAPLPFLTCKLQT